MSKEDLCWECREKLESTYISTLGKHFPSYVDSMPWIHCHHEPKEKRICWCEEPTRGKPTEIVIFDMKLPLIFCPECGRKL